MLEMLIIIALTLTLPLNAMYIQMPRIVNVEANRNAGGSVQCVQFDKQIGCYRIFMKFVYRN